MLSTKLSGLVILNVPPFIALVILLSALSIPFSISLTTKANGFLGMEVCGNIDDCAEPWFWFIYDANELPTSSNWFELPVVELTSTENSVCGVVFINSTLPVIVFCVESPVGTFSITPFTISETVICGSP